MLGIRWATVGAVVLALGGAAGASSIDAFIEAAEEADVVILGEVHDNPEHHANQARIVEALQPAAIVFEMIPQESEDAVNQLRAEGAPPEAIANALDWSESGWPPFDLYAPILAAAPEARIFGAGQPSAEIRRATVEGAAGPFGPDAKIFGLDQPLEPEVQAAREALMAETHCDALPPEVLPGMVEAQRFRDAGLADATLWARTLTGGGQVVVITGNGHADRQRGVPQMLGVADEEVTVVSLGQLEGEPDAAAAEAYDAVIVTGAPDRADPCAQLRE